MRVLPAPADGMDSEAEAAPVSEPDSAEEVRVVVAEALVRRVLLPEVGYGAVELATMTAVVAGTKSSTSQQKIVIEVARGVHFFEAVNSRLRVMAA